MNAGTPLSTLRAALPQQAAGAAGAAPVAPAAAPAATPVTTPPAAPVAAGVPAPTQAATAFGPDAATTQVLGASAPSRAPSPASTAAFAPHPGQGTRSGSQAASLPPAMLAGMTRLAPGLGPGADDPPLTPIKLPRNAQFHQTLTALTAKMRDPSVTKETAARIYQMHERMHEFEKQAIGAWVNR